jgi:hypothetical protein
MQLAAMNFANSAGLCGLAQLIIPMLWMRAGWGESEIWRLWQTVGPDSATDESQKLHLHRHFLAFLWTRGFGTSL